MDNNSTVKSFKKLTLKHIKEKVKLVKEQLPDAEKNAITYSKNFTLSLSNYCQNHCGYCFYNQRIPKDNQHPNTVLISEDQINDYTQIALNYGCTEALLMSGEAPDSFKLVQSELKNRNYSNFFQFVKELSEDLLRKNLIIVITFQKSKETL